MKKVLILIGHGDIPYDFPKEKLKEYFKLRTLQRSGSINEEEKRYFLKLEEELKKWKRNKSNDSHYFNIKKFSKYLQKKINIKVDFAFNEFCSPDIKEKFEEIKDKYDEFYFLPTMIFSGKHTHFEIKKKIEDLKKENPDKKIFYVYPLKEDLVKKFFVGIIKEFINK